MPATGVKDHKVGKSSYSRGEGPGWHPPNRVKEGSNGQARYDRKTPAAEGKAPKWVAAIEDIRVPVCQRSILKGETAIRASKKKNGQEEDNGKAKTENVKAER